MDTLVVEVVLVVNLAAFLTLPTQMLVVILEEVRVIFIPVLSEVAGAQSALSGQETFASSPQLAQQMNKESNNGIRTT